MNKYERRILSEMCFWNKQYYKLGIIDGNQFNKELEEISKRVKLKYNKSSIDI